MSQVSHRWHYCYQSAVKRSVLPLLTCISSKVASIPGLPVRGNDRFGKALCTVPAVSVRVLARHYWRRTRSSVSMMHYVWGLGLIRVIGVKRSSLLST